MQRVMSSGVSDGRTGGKSPPGSSLPLHSKQFDKL